MSTSPFGSLRRRITALGARPATTAWLDLPHGGSAGPSRSAEVVESPFSHHAVGTPLPWSEDVAFLDGTQHVELVGTLGTDPLVAAVIKAAVRIRRKRRMSVAVVETRRVVVARRHVFEALGPAVSPDQAIVLDVTDPPHPLRDLERCHAMIDLRRADLEADVARQFRSTHDCWMVIDGTLSLHAAWTADAKMLGVVKSHGVLPLDGEMLDHYLSLPAGHRTSVFSADSRQRTALHMWGLRLQPWEGHDLFHGLVRVETTPASNPSEVADRLSRHLLAERSPMTSAPRADRLLYGIHDVGRYLRVHGAAS